MALFCNVPKDAVIEEKDKDFSIYEVPLSLVDHGLDSLIVRKLALGLKAGLPEGSLGKIGLAMSPQSPDVLYAAIELNRREGAVYRSTDRGSSSVFSSRARASR